MQTEMAKTFRTLSIGQLYKGSSQRTQRDQEEAEGITDVRATLSFSDNTCWHVRCREIVIRQFLEESLKKRNSYPDDQDILLKYTKKIRVIRRYPPLFTIRVCHKQWHAQMCYFGIKIQYSALCSFFKQKKDAFIQIQLLYKGHTIRILKNILIYV